ncbi:MAG: threonylcarbamoyl-AMP synthase [Dehalococcoidia bacterium]|nr:MAG: threonylcarbamoyl-AMP synthase [Dehalococcoidia bacterium]
MDSLQQQVEKGIEILKKGGIIAFPTDTVYGLGCDAFCLRAVERIYEVKRRPRHLPFPLLLGDISQVTTVAKPLSGIALSLARRFWPGALTLVLPKSDSLPLYLSSGGTVAVRIPDHPICFALIQGIGSPLVGTSANISGSYSALTADEVEQQLRERVDFIVDGGKCPGGNESTVVDATGVVPRILRQGIIPRHEIETLWSAECVLP